MERPTDNLDEIAQGIRESFSTLDEARERVLPLCREVIRYSSTAIRALHRQEFEAAAKLLASARDQLEETERAAGDCGELKHTGFFRDAQKEFAEASITLALSVFGVDQSRAFSFALISHITHVAMTTIFGVYALAREGIDLGEIWRLGLEGKKEE